MDEHLLFLFSFLDEVEKEIADDAEKQVWIEKCINIKTLSDFTVSCSYGDIAGHVHIPAEMELATTKSIMKIHSHSFLLDTRSYGRKYG